MFGRFDLAALRGCHTLFVCLLVLVVESALDSQLTLGLGLSLMVILQRWLDC
jgi:hypothetical protein